MDKVNNLSSKSNNNDNSKKKWRPKDYVNQLHDTVSRKLESKSNDISSSAKLVLAYIATFKGHLDQHNQRPVFYQKNSKIAENLGMKVSKVSKAIASLAKYKYITILYNNKNNPNYIKSNPYNRRYIKVDLSKICSTKDMMKPQYKMKPTQGKVSNSKTKDSVSKSQKDETPKEKNTNSTTTKATNQDNENESVAQNKNTGGKNNYNFEKLSGNHQKELKDFSEKLVKFMKDNHIVGFQQAYAPDNAPIKTIINKWYIIDYLADPKNKSNVNFDHLKYVLSWIERKYTKAITAIENARKQQEKEWLINFDPKYINKCELMIYDLTYNICEYIIDKSKLSIKQIKESEPHVKVSKITNDSNDLEEDTKSVYTPHKDKHKKALEKKLNKASIADTKNKFKLHKFWHRRNLAIKYNDSKPKIVKLKKESNRLYNRQIDLDHHVESLERKEKKYL